jgi:hypothetical protein
MHQFEHLLDDMHMLCSTTTMHHGAHFANENTSNLYFHHEYWQDCNCVKGKGGRGHCSKPKCDNKVFFFQASKSSFFLKLSTTNSIHSQRPFCDSCQEPIEDGFGVGCKNASRCFGGRCNECINDEQKSCQYSENPYWQCEKCEVL